MIVKNIINFINQFNIETARLIISLIVIIIVLIIYKFLSRTLTRVSKQLELEPHITNSLFLILRVLVIVSAIAIISTIYEVPATWFLGSSALIGAALGFGSSQTINNIIAGFYVILSRPFKVKDYIKIGDNIEGQVEEITINYTKLYTPAFNILLIPNTQVMNSRITNCTHEGFIRYVFSLSFPHGLSNEEIIKKCIEPAIEEFHEKYIDKQLRKPEYYFESLTHLSKSFRIRIFIPKGEAKTLYQLQPELLDMITKRWEAIIKK
ncbi:MAG: mechanosensitive ion channel [Nitrososphaerota archaeon]